MGCSSRRSIGRWDGLEAITSRVIFSTHFDRSLFFSQVEASSVVVGSLSTSKPSFERSLRLALLLSRLVIDRNARVFAECDRRVRLLCISKTITYHHISIRKLPKTSQYFLTDSRACFGANLNVYCAGDTHINSWFLCATASPLRMSTTDMKIIGLGGLHL